MQREIMIAIDDSIHSKTAVDYAVKIYQAIQDVKFNVIHIHPTISQYLMDEAKSNPQAYAELQKLTRRHAEIAHKLFDKCKNHMVGAGVAEENIVFKSQFRMRGVAKDILQASSAGLYDALIMGRRGLSGLQEKLVGSVSASLINSTVDTPVWLVDEEGPSSDIMVAVDGSEPSFKAVDHLAFIMSGNTELKITLFHLAPRLQDFIPGDIEDEDIDSEALEEFIQKGDKQRIDQFYVRVKKRFDEAGIRNNQINFVAKKGAPRVGKIGKAVLDEYHKGKFGTLVVGRRGINKKLFTGTVSTYLVNQFTAGALWVVA